MQILQKVHRYPGAILARNSLSEELNRRPLGRICLALCCSQTHLAVIRTLGIGKAECRQRLCLLRSQPIRLGSSDPQLDQPVDQEWVAGLVKPMSK